MDNKNLSISVLAENHVEAMNDFLEKIFVAKTGYSGDIKNEKELSKFVRENNYKLEYENIGLDKQYCIKRNDDIIAKFKFNTIMESDGFNIKATVEVKEIK